jgi:hypothetical protein
MFETTSKDHLPIRATQLTLVVTSFDDIIQQMPSTLLILKFFILSGAIFLDGHWI